MGNSDLDAVLAPHPVIEQLSRSENSQGGAGVISVCGFIGKSGEPNRVRIHSSLESLEFWLEVDRADILYATVVNQEFHRVRVWLRENAYADWGPVQPDDSGLNKVAAPATGTLPSTKKSELILVNRGRLRMILRSGNATAMMTGTSGPMGGTGGGRCLVNW